MNVLQNYVWGLSKKQQSLIDPINTIPTPTNDNTYYIPKGGGSWIFVGTNNGRVYNSGVDTYQYFLQNFHLPKNIEYLIVRDKEITPKIGLVDGVGYSNLKEVDISESLKLHNINFLGCTALEKIYVHQNTMNKLLNNTIKLKREQGYTFNSFYVPSRITLANFFVKP
ncbi:hypothetical protein [Capnocytophaga canis]|uniref:hypothetical protein n=1 Tax=Capnocytophaga canis TaxID=1848903 RepID=UPI0037D273B6